MQRTTVDSQLMWTGKLREMFKFYNFIKNNDS